MRGEPLLDLRHLRGPGGAVGDAVVGLEISEERPQRRERPRRRAPGETAPLVLAQETPDAEPVHRGRLPGTAVEPAAEGGERGEVPAEGLGGGGGGGGALFRGGGG